MAAAFGAYLGSASFRSGKTPPEIAHLAALETGIAQVRRSSPPPPPPTGPMTAESWLRIAPGVALQAVHPDTLPRYSQVLASLRQHGGSLIEAVLDTQHRLPHGPAFRGEATEFVLVSQIPDGDGPSLESMTDELGKLLAAAKTPTLWRDLCALVEEMGGEPEEAQEVIAGLVDDRILVLWPDHID